MASQNHISKKYGSQSRSLRSLDFDYHKFFTDTILTGHIRTYISSHLFIHSRKIMKLCLIRKKNHITKLLTIF